MNLKKRAPDEREAYYIGKMAGMQMELAAIRAERKALQLAVAMEDWEAVKDLVDQYKEW